MKALVWRGGRSIELEEVPEPERRDGEELLEVRVAGICGSDLHPYRGHAGPRRPPLVLGHEAVGEVAGRSGRFTVFPLVTCRECRACRRGEENLCERRGLLGLDRQGVFAERVAVAADSLVPLPDALDPRLGALVEPLAASVSVCRIERVEPGATVVVVGGGPIGLLAVYWCARRGARVLAVEPLAARRLLAERLGATAVHADVAELPAGEADLAIDAVGVEAAWRGAIAAVRPGGSVALVGLGQAEGAMPVADLVRRGIGVHGHYAYTRPDFEAALRLLSEDPPPLDWLTVLPLADGAEGFRRLADEPDRYAKVLLAIADGAV
jgi:threonine dehydrogenase-like Zn-dependent dehydrogenase